MELEDCKLRKLKKVNPVVWVSIIVFLCIVLIVGVFFFNKNQKALEAKSMEDTSALQGQLNALMQNVYVAAADIDMGELITETNVVPQTIMSDRDPSLLITAEDIGRIATVDIAAGTPVYKSCVSEEMKKDLTERECNFIYLNGNLVDNDYVDVRIMFPNGEDMVVVAKTPVKSPITTLNNCYLWLSETQNDLLSSAIVDASLNGARLYVNKYVRPEVEDASIVTYQPNPEVIALMQTNPAVISQAEDALNREVSLNKDARTVLDQNLKNFFEEHAEEEYEINFEISEGASDSAAAAGSVDGAAQDVVNNVVPDPTAPATDGTTDGAAATDATTPVE